jgi:hypothetical protein
LWINREAIQTPDLKWWEAGIPHERLHKKLQRKFVYIGLNKRTERERKNEIYPFPLPLPSPPPPKKKDAKVNKYERNRWAVVLVNGT